MHSYQLLHWWKASDLVHFKERSHLDINSTRKETDKSAKYKIYAMAVWLMTMVKLVRNFLSELSPAIHSEMQFKALDEQIQFNCINALFIKCEHIFRSHRNSTNHFGVSFITRKTIAIERQFLLIANRVGVSIWWWSLSICHDRSIEFRNFVYSCGNKPKAIHLCWNNQI